MYKAKGRVTIDKEKLKTALKRKGITLRSVGVDHYYSRAWLGTMVSHGYVTATAMEILKEYGITKEEIQK